MRPYSTELLARLFPQIYARLARPIRGGVGCKPGEAVEDAPVGPWDSRLMGLLHSGFREEGVLTSCCQFAGVVAFGILAHGLCVQARVL